MMLRSTVVSVLGEVPHRTRDRRTQTGGTERGTKNLKPAARPCDEKRRFESELKWLVEAIATGSGSRAIMAAITERAKRLQEITNQVMVSKLMER